MTLLLLTLLLACYLGLAFRLFASCAFSVLALALAVVAFGGACGIALLGRADSDIAGFSVIALSPMGLFSNFGIFSAAMIFLSLIASLVLTTAALGILHQLTSSDSEEEE